MTILRMTIWVLVATLLYAVLALSALGAVQVVWPWVLYKLATLFGTADSEYAEIWLLYGLRSPDLRYSIPPLLAFLPLSIFNANGHLTAFMWMGFFAVAVGSLLAEVIMTAFHLSMMIDWPYAISASLYLATLLSVAAVMSLKMTQYIQYYDWELFRSAERVALFDAQGQLGSYRIGRSFNRRPANRWRVLEKLHGPHKYSDEWLEYYLNCPAETVLNRAPAISEFSGEPIPEDRRDMFTFSAGKLRYVVERIEQDKSFVSRILDHFAEGERRRLNSLPDPDEDDDPWYDLRDYSNRFLHEILTDEDEITITSIRNHAFYLVNYKNHRQVA